MRVCPLIVTLDCSKTATYWDGVGTAVIQAAYVMRHFFFSLSLSPSISVCLHSEKIRWCRNAWDYREAWLRVCCSPGCGWEKMRSVCSTWCQICCLYGVGRDVQNYIFSESTSWWVAWNSQLVNVKKALALSVGRSFYLLFDRSIVLL